MQHDKCLVKVLFEKDEPMCYFSQLDLVRVFERALRRTPLDVYYTKGFNPHVKMSFGRALKLGVKGIEEVVFYFLGSVSLDEVRKELEAQLPQGLRLLHIEHIDTLKNTTAT